ncbi:MAG: tetratricopeptide repeat protein [Ignavibacteria bacterium]|nr:MAG: tetratricopeptide repeat protein [Ignavibacteria bacterium]
MRSILSFVLMIVFAVGVFAQSLDDNNDAKKLYNEGIRLMKSGNYSGSIEKFDEALKLVDDYRLHFYKGQVLRKQKKFEEAIPFYETAINKNPDYFPSYFYLGSSYFALKNYEKAKEYFDITLQKTKNKKIVKAVKKNLKVCDEKLAYPFLVKGNNEKSLGNYKAAIENFNKVLEYYESDGAYLGLADSYLELGENEKAIEAASKAIAHRRTIPKGSPYFFIGMAHERMGNKEQAKQNFEQCLADKSKANKGFRKRAEYELKQLNK